MFHTLKNKVLLPLICFASFNANAGLIDYSNWTIENLGFSQFGNWQIAADGNSVEQTFNSIPTFFLSDTDYFNVSIEGTFRVDSTADDDFIGFAFGYQNIEDFLLFDWKKAAQSNSSEGFTLSQVSGSDVNLWSHIGSDISVLGSDYSATNGWASLTTYEFKLNYTESNIEISINDDIIFNVGGSYDTGKFGFYNYSQANSIFSITSITDIPLNNENKSDIPEPSVFVLMIVGLLGCASRKLKR